MTTASGEWSAGNGLLAIAEITLTHCPECLFRSPLRLRLKSLIDLMAHGPGRLIFFSRLFQVFGDDDSVCPSSSPSNHPHPCRTFGGGPSAASGGVGERAEGDGGGSMAGHVDDGRGKWSK